jgi:hypothetical protein
MKDVLPGEASPHSPQATPFDAFEEIRSRLVRAQEAESDAMRRLGRASQQQEIDKIELRRLVIEAQMARDLCLHVYAEWQDAVERFYRSRT